MKILKYLGIIAAIILMFYAKNQIDTRNKAEVNALDSLDQDNGTIAVKKK